ncbi:flagellar hook-basal body protein [Virgibacillus sp. W0181]|uniref:flagellar hook-basal body protein n=1 Tax=Virgibacillus sp. W0181 TaxID=3391581 RepID=UPI003F484693
MSRSMIQSVVTMNQLQHKLDVIGHNLANSQTTGYKSRETEFSSLLFQQMNNLSDPGNATGRLTPDGLRIGSGAKLGGIHTNNALGSIQETDRALDTLLLQENTLYQISVTDGGATETHYTRDGAFYLQPVNNDTDVMLTTSDGHPVLGLTGPIVIPQGFDAIDIHPSGQITVKRGNETEVVGNLAIVEAVRPRLLETTGQNAFRLPDLAVMGYNYDDIIEAADPTVDVLKSGALEQSNVDLAKQMTDLLMTQRSYQFNARTISMGDQMQGLINQLR